MDAAADSFQPDPYVARPPLLPAPWLEWQAEYSVGIGIIDAHHLRIFELLDQSREALGRPQEGTVLRSVLNELIDTTRLHFAAEEVLMQAFGYPEMLPHQFEHERLTRALLEFQEQFALGQERLASPLLDFLGGWLVRHILENDRKYAGFFAERGAIP